MRIVPFNKEAKYFLMLIFFWNTVVLFAQNKVPLPHYKEDGKILTLQAIDSPHWNNGIDCGSCHIAHQSAGAQLTDQSGNANLCMSCHNPGGLASSLPFSNSNRAEPGNSGNSHAWEVSANSYSYGANPPANSEMAARIYGGGIVCSTCHNQHDQTYQLFLRGSNYRDALCKDCHSVRNVGSYRTNSNNKGSHPVGIAYPTSDNRFYSSPQNSSFPLIDPNRVECSTCHSVHYANTNDGYILNGSNNDNLCQSCHTYEDHVGQGCKKCHDIHDPNRTNILLVGRTVSTPNSGTKSVVFTAEAGTNSFADGNSTYDGICEVCHTSTSYHRNNSGGNHQHESGEDCTHCHPHDENFRAKSCDECHDEPQDNGDGIPSGGRRAVFGEFAETSHHLHGSSLNTDDCKVCHDMSQHMQGKVRLINADNQNEIYVLSSSPMNNASEASKLVPFCKNCHDGDANAPFSDGKIPPAINSSRWNSSAHKTGGSSNMPLRCIGDGVDFGCHATGHGSSNVKMLNDESSSSLETFCYNCHTNGRITNNAISGGSLADDIEQSFSFLSPNKHNLGSSFTIGSNSYLLECTTCHNPHVATGKYWEADQNKSPITRPNFSDPVNNPRAMGSVLWGNEPGEKMDDYVGDGTYRTPNGDPFDGGELPDYVSLCLDCHGVGAMPDPPTGSGGISWGSDEPHGTRSADVPQGGGAIPDWWTAGKAEGWDLDDRTDVDAAWPVLPRGRGEQIWTRGPYHQEDRIGGANFILSCTDCHEAHGSNWSSMVRSELNDTEGSGVPGWPDSPYFVNDACNSCHYYRSDWHAGPLGCVASYGGCHIPQGRGGPRGTMHSIWGGTGGTGSTRTFDRNLVLHYAFNGNFNDSGDWRMHGKWFDGASGSFTSGKSGQAINLNGNQLVQVGTRNEYWSTDAGRHGTWKYTEMKFNSTLEAWVYPTEATSQEYSIFAKHVGLNNGGYAFTLSKIDGTLRATFNAKMDNNGNSQGGASSIRGAFSSVAIPLNTWTHVGVTFNSSGPGRSSSDPSVGRIRIYVNGEDVTTSSSSGNNMQPSSGENSIYAYSENSPWNESVCYNGHWCASEFSIGGFTWQNGFVGRIDEAKVWNITKNATYFQTIDSQEGPYISNVTGVIGSNQITVTFSEGVYTNPGSSGALVPGDFTFTGSGLSISSVNHSTGSASAVLTLSGPLPTICTDYTLAAASSAIYDNYNLTADTTPVTLNVTLGTGCQVSPVTFNLNDDPACGYALDNQGKLIGEVGDAGTLTGSAFYGDGGSTTPDAVSHYIYFDSHNTCLEATTNMTIEARIKPTGIPGGTENSFRRIFDKEQGASYGYELQIFRNLTKPERFPTFNPPDNVASIALWVTPLDKRTPANNGWKPVLSDYDLCPITNDHWYLVKVVWDSDKVGGTPGQFFVPADIYIDDQGPNGDDVGESWSGYINCTDADQSYVIDDWKFWTGDRIGGGDGPYVIGAASHNVEKGNLQFNGLIDWIKWSNIDATP